MLLLEGKMTRGGRFLDSLYFCQAASIRQAEFVNWHLKTDSIIYLNFYRAIRYPPYDASKMKLFEKYCWIAVPGVKNGMGLGMMFIIFVVVLILAFILPNYLWTSHIIMFIRYICMLGSNISLIVSLGTQYVEFRWTRDGYGCWFWQILYYTTLPPGKYGKCINSVFPLFLTKITTDNLV